MPTYKETRDIFRPDAVRFLFIGESRPANGTFFYNENSNLYRYTIEAFEKALGKPFNCELFKRYGCWLYDVCEEPVNNLTDSEKRTHILNGLPKLKEALTEIKPEYIFIIKKGIFGRIVYPYLLQLGYDKASVFLLPFPACGQQRRYVQELSAILESLLEVTAYEY